MFSEWCGGHPSLELTISPTSITYIPLWGESIYHQWVKAVHTFQREGVSLHRGMEYRTDTEMVKRSRRDDLYNSHSKQMKLFSSIAAAALIGTSFIAPNSSQAATSKCYQTDSNATVCIHSVRYNRSNPNYRQVTSTVNGGGYAVHNVICHPHHRYNYKANMYGIACFQFN